MEPHYLMTIFTDNQDLNQYKVYKISHGVKNKIYKRLEEDEADVLNHLFFDDLDGVEHFIADPVVCMVEFRLSTEQLSI